MMGDRVGFLPNWARTILFSSASGRQLPREARGQQGQQQGHKDQVDRTS